MIAAFDSVSGNKQMSLSAGQAINYIATPYGYETHKRHCLHAGFVPLRYIR